MSRIRWGIIGPGSIANNFAIGIGESENGVLVAIASRSPDRLADFGDRYAIAAERRYGDYAELCADPEVDAIYVATPHPFHRDQALMVIAAGKHLALEKPAGLTAAEVRQIVAAARARGVFFMEGYMYLHHPQIARAIAILKSGALGAVQHIRASFGFAAPFNAQSRLYAKELAGGGILDVGGYTVSAARVFAGIAEGDLVMPSVFRATGILGRTGVDEIAMAVLQFPNGITAEISCAVARTIGEQIELRCEKGMMRLDRPWLPGKEKAPADSRILTTLQGVETVEEIAAPHMLYTYEINAMGRGIQAGDTAFAYPAMTPEGSIGNAALLDDWRHQLGYFHEGEPRT